MYAAHFISDAAVFPPPLPPRGGFDLRASDGEAASHKAGVIASLRSFLAAHAPSRLASSLGFGH